MNGLAVELARPDSRGRLSPQGLRLYFCTCVTNFHLEPITHFLTGAILARTGFNRKTALATATMTLAAEAPDLDVFWSFKGPVVGFAHHRGFTHSFVGLILVSAVVIGFMYLVWRLRGRRTNLPNLPPRWGVLFLFAYVAGLSHILLDYTNNYGVRPFWPFWETWDSWGVVFIVEPALIIILMGRGPSVLSRNFLAARSRCLAEVQPHGLHWSVWWDCGLICRAIRSHRKAMHALEHQQFKSAMATTRFGLSVLDWHVGFRWSAVAETP